MRSEFTCVTASVSFLVPGRTYVLLFRSVTPEDMGEIRFMAEKASSSAKLKVKGKRVESQHIIGACVSSPLFLLVHSFYSITVFSARLQVKYLFS